MPTSAHDVAAALRARHPAMSIVKLHKLLYYCQGHHLATFGRPLFSESVSAWDMGPVVGAVWWAEKHGDVVSHRDLDEAELNTVGYVLSRYGGLTAGDLVRLTHTEEPWRLADVDRRPGTSTRIKNEWIETFFRSESGADDSEVILDAHTVGDWLAGAGARRSTGATTDRPDEIEARVAALRARIEQRG